MKITNRMEGDVFVININGKLLGGSPESDLIKNLVYEKLDKIVRKFVFNLTKTSRINSSGWGVLIQCLTAIKDKGGHLKLAGNNELIEGAMEMTKFYTVFETCSTADAAVNDNWNFNWEYRQK